MINIITAFLCIALLYIIVVDDSYSSYKESGIIYSIESGYPKNKSFITLPIIQNTTVLWNIHKSSLFYDYLQSKDEDFREPNVLYRIFLIKLSNFLRQLSPRTTLKYAIIGASDGTTQDVRFVLNHSDRWIGVMVEPTQLNYDTLSGQIKLNRFPTRIQLMRAVVTDTCRSSRIHVYVPPYEGISSSRTNQTTPIPHWIRRQISSLRPPSLQFMQWIESYYLHNETDETVASVAPMRWNKELVDCISYETLLTRWIAYYNQHRSDGGVLDDETFSRPIDVLQVDTEGHDFNILRQVLGSRYAMPLLMMFEVKLMTLQERQTLSGMLRQR